MANTKKVLSRTRIFLELLRRLRAAIEKGEISAVNLEWFLGLAKYRMLEKAGEYYPAPTPPKPLAPLPGWTPPSISELLPAPSRPMTPGPAAPPRPLPKAPTLVLVAPIDLPLPPRPVTFGAQQPPTPPRPMAKPPVPIASAPYENRKITFPSAQADQGGDP